jgi:hypothetical protein
VCPRLTVRADGAVATRNFDGTDRQFITSRAAQLLGNILHEHRPIRIHQRCFCLSNISETYRAIASSAGSMPILLVIVALLQILLRDVMTGVVLRFDGFAPDRD